MIRLQSDGLYNIAIQQFFAQYMSNLSLSSTVLLNSLEEAFYANKDIRLGAKPDVEHLYRVRRIFDKYIQAREPIPVLIPWGSKKGGTGNSVDIAEVMALSQLIALNERVKRIYPYGIKVNIRIEDLTGYKVYEGDDDMSTILADTDKYVKDFISLIKIMGANFINPLRESELFLGDKQKFFSTVDFIADKIKDYLAVTEEVADEELIAYSHMLPEKWAGTIPSAQREYYYQKYDKLYGNKNMLWKQLKLATYLASSYARRLYEFSGTEAKWGGDYIQVTFVSPVNGLPKDFDLHYVYYRTVPERYARTHLAPWRAKGYFKILDGYVCPKLTTFSDNTEMYSETMVMFEDKSYVKVATPYILV